MSGSKETTTAAGAGEGSIPSAPRVSAPVAPGVPAAPSAKPAQVFPADVPPEDPEARREYFAAKYGEDAQRAWEEQQAAGGGSWQADKTTHATVSRLNEEYKMGGERNMAPPVESAFTGSADCFAGVDPYAALKDDQ